MQEQVIEFFRVQMRAHITFAGDVELPSYLPQLYDWISAQMKEKTASFLRVRYEIPNANLNSNSISLCNSGVRTSFIDLAADVFYMVIQL